MSEVGVDELLVVGGPQSVVAFEEEGVVHQMGSVEGVVHLMGSIEGDELLVVVHKGVDCLLVRVEVVVLVLQQSV
jgi:hypothetical protein